MTDIEYAAEELIERLDQLAIDDLLRAKLMLYILKSFESEEVLDHNCAVLDHEKSLSLRKVPLCFPRREETSKIN